MATSHPAEGLDGDAFGAFLVGEGVLIGPRNQSLIVDFGVSFLWPCMNKQTQDYKRCDYDMKKRLAFVGRLLSGMRMRRCYQENQLSKYRLWDNHPKLTLVVMRRTLKTFSRLTWHVEFEG